MEDNIYKIQENINRIFIEIEENAGEITEEQLEQLNINQENLKQKLSDYNKAIQVYKNYNEGISNEIKRLQELKKTRTNRIEVLRNTMKNAVINFGTDGKSGIFPLCRLSRGSDSCSSDRLRDSALYGILRLYGHHYRKWKVVWYLPSGKLPTAVLCEESFGILAQMAYYTRRVVQGIYFLSGIGIRIG